ncbi:hypothetical protein ACD589_27280 [Rhizobium sp. 814_E9_N1_1]|uniref:hypothetical protein n=1 Tax=unclassified Rhizobium TaxID=2613769 RepID=UPI003F25B78C
MIDAANRNTYCSSCTDKTAGAPSPGGRGRLRLLYEVCPIATTVEASGGRCSTGSMPILALPAETLHDRVPPIFGGASQVEAIEAAYLDSKLELQH